MAASTTASVMNGVVITLFPQEGGEAKKVFLTGENENRIVVAGTNYLPLSESNANFALVSYLTQRLAGYGLWQGRHTKHRLRRL